MSQAKLEFLAGKSVPAIIDWMLENMKETDIKGCLDAAGIQSSVGSRSAPQSSGGAGSSTDPLPPPRRAAAAGSSTDPLPFSRAAAAGSSTEPLQLLRIPSAGLSRERTSDIPFFTPGSATGLLPSREPSPEEIRESIYQPPISLSPFSIRRELSEEIDPYSTFIAPGLRRPLLGGDNDFGNVLFNFLPDINRYIKIQIEEQDKARENNSIGQRINIPILIFNLVEEGEDYLSFIQFEPSGQSGLILTGITTLHAMRKPEDAPTNEQLEKQFRKEINTLLKKWGTLLDISTEEDYRQWARKINDSFEGFILQNPLYTANIKEIIETLYSKTNIEVVRNGQEYTPENFEGDLDLNGYGFKEETEGDLDLDGYELKDDFEDDLDKYDLKDDFEGDFSKKKVRFQDDLKKDNFPASKLKKVGKISDMNKEELREYVINKFGQNYYNEYEPQVYTTKSGFGNVRYVKRSSPLTDSRITVPDYDYSIEQPENSAVNLFD